jgi:SPOR domain
MSAVGYAQRRGLRDMAARERRKKVLALGGVGLLALVLVIQVPKTLDMLSSESSGVTGSSGVVTASPTPQAAAEAPRPRPRVLRTARVDDPFAGSRAGAGDSRPGTVGAPAGMRDPFQLRSASPAPVVRIPRRIVVGTPGTRAPRIGYTVVLASIPTSNSRAQAVRFARTARARGVSGVGVLRSSARNRLRSGYWVVYSGMFRNSAGAQRAAAQVHARGYRTAYLRQLVRY